MGKLLVNVSPHVSSKESTKGIMKDVIIALMPATLVGTYLFGLYALSMTLLTILTCVLTETVWNKVRKVENTIGDYSAIVTGLILGLNLPPYVPFYIPIVGGIFAIALVKMLFGGLGRNFANPAATARVMLLLSWVGIMTTFYSPIEYTGIMDFFSYPPMTDAFATATPLGLDKAASATALVWQSTAMEGFLGNIAGSFGETSALALLMGGIYLIARKVIGWKIPVVIILGTAAFGVLFGNTVETALTNVLFGGLFIGAFFMATDYSTSPNTDTSRVIYALMIAFITVLVREIGGYPEGMSFAIILANICVPLFDRYIIPKSFGDGRDTVALVTNVAVFGFIAITLLVGFVL